MHLFSLLYCLSKTFSISPLFFSSLGSFNHRIEQVNKWYQYCANCLDKCRTLPLHLQTHNQTHTHQLPCLFFFFLTILILRASPFDSSLSHCFLSRESFYLVSYGTSQKFFYFLNYSPASYTYTICKFEVQVYFREDCLRDVNISPFAHFNHYLDDIN